MHCSAHFLAGAECGGQTILSVAGGEVRQGRDREEGRKRGREGERVPTSL